MAVNFYAETCEFGVCWITQFVSNSFSNSRQQYEKLLTGLFEFSVLYLQNYLNVLKNQHQALMHTHLTSDLCARLFRRPAGVTKLLTLSLTSFSFTNT